MRPFKFILGGILLIFLAIVVMQNPHVFWQKKSLRLDLWLWRDQSPDIALAIYFLTFFLVGFLGAYFFSLAERFRTKKTVSQQQHTIQRLEKEVEALKGAPGPDETGTYPERPAEEQRLDLPPEERP